MKRHQKGNQLESVDSLSKDSGHDSDCSEVSCEADQREDESVKHSDLVSGELEHRD